MRIKIFKPTKLGPKYTFKGQAAKCKGIHQCQHPLSLYFGH